MGFEEIEDQFNPSRVPVASEDDFLVVDEETDGDDMVLTFGEEVEDEWLVPVEEQQLGILESTIPPDYRNFSQWTVLDNESVTELASTAVRATASRATASSTEMASHHLISAPPLVICTCELIPGNDDPCPLTELASNATRATTSIEMPPHQLISAPPLPLVICTCEIMPENNENLSREPCPLKTQVMIEKSPSDAGTSAPATEKEQSDSKA